jgi:class 3 adenylate cyclase
MMSKLKNLEELKSYAAGIEKNVIEQARKLRLLSEGVKLSHDWRQDSQTIATHPEYQELKEVQDTEIDNMVCLFVDMVGSTQRKTLGSVQWKDLLTNQLYLCMVTIIACDQDGILAGYRGDGGFFVWPYGDEAKRSKFHAARRASEQMFDCLDEVVNPILARYNIEAIKVRTGIASGRVLVSRVGLPGATELTIIGSPADRASKLAIGPGRQINCDKPLRDLIESSPTGRLKIVEGTDSFKILC